MTPARLTTWFRKRMAALVIASTLIAWLAFVVSYHLQKRHELVLLCRADARDVASFVAESVQQRPVLWRYDGAKLADRIAAQGLGTREGLLVRDLDGRPVDLGSVGGQGIASLIWGQAPAVVGDRVVASVWVGTEARSLWRHTIVLGLVTGLIALTLALLLYFVPVRTVGLAEQRIVALMSRLALAMQEGERARIARDLHDGAGQAITAARLGLLAMRRKLGAVEGAEQLDTIAGLLDGALDEVRRSTTALMPPALAELGFTGAIRRHCEAFSAASGMAITCDFGQDLPPAPTHTHTACYRIIQEALSNAARHAGAKNAVVGLRTHADRWCLEVTDDGVGFVPDRSGTGSGLASIQERVRLLGGTFSLTPSPRGTVLHVQFPSEGADV